MKVYARTVASIGTLALCAGLLAGCVSHHAGTMKGEPEDATFAEVRETRIRFVDEGEGPAVVLIHGFASSLETWDGIRPQLVEQGRRVLAMDLKGFGWSGRPEGRYSPQEQARIVYSLMDERGIHEVAVVGHSYGASVALAMALARPHRVTRLGLYDAWVYKEQLPTFFHWARGKGVGEALFGAFYDERPEDRLVLAFHDPQALPQKLVDDVERALERPGTKAAALAAVRDMQYSGLQERYGEIEQPTLLLWGREDRVAPVTVGERLYNQLPRASLKVYPQCGHFPMIEAARPSTRDLLEFLHRGEGPP